MNYIDQGIEKALLEKNLIDEESLAKAKSLQKKSNLRLDQVLLKKGLVIEKDIMQILASQYDLLYEPRLEVKNIQKLVQQIDLKFVQKYKIVPYQLQKNQIKVALLDPLQFHPLDELRLSLPQYNIVPVLSNESELLKIIHRDYEQSERDESQDIGLESGLEFLDDIQDLGSSMDLANEAPIIKMVNVILSNAVNDGASDVHIEPQEKEVLIRYRVDGMLRKVLNPPKQIQSGIISRIKIMANMNIAENRLPQDGRIKIRFSGKEIDIRVSSLPSHFGERIVMRLLNKTDTKFELDSIGFDKDVLDNFKKLIQNPHGIVLITGPTGSGKTSTLYAALTSLNDEKRNIITVEDPVEYQMDGISQVQARPKIGLTFAEGLRTILRQDPDIIMVGEIRDEETARVAIQSALTGHLVFSTLHTNDAPSSITRLIDMGLEPYLVSSTCLGFMAQRLVRKLCNKCKKKETITVNEIKKLGYDKVKAKKPFTIYKALGCDECFNSGYKGRTGIYELLVLNENLRTMIQKLASVDELRKECEKQGMRGLRKAALDKVVLGVTSLDEILRVT